ncbi:hypothetical protein J6590_079453, partial [Homalodisca vitripennis]
MAVDNPARRPLLQLRAAPTIAHSNYVTVRTYVSAKHLRLRAATTSHTYVSMQHLRLNAVPTSPCRTYISVQHLRLNAAPKS